MITLKSPDEIEKMRSANQIVVRVLKTLKGKMVPGTATLELDQIAESMIREAGGKPAFKGYRGFQHTLCVSINEEVVHGIPSKRVLKTGDVVSIDCGVFLNGFYGDHAWSFPVGAVSPAAKKLLETGEVSLNKAIDQMVVGNRLQDISVAVQEYVEAQGFSVVRDFVGHGIGTELHEEPQLPNFGIKGRGLRIKEGLVLACEPMINAGTYEVETLKDGWTVVTLDRQLSVHFEHSVAVTGKGPDVLSKWG